MKCESLRLFLKPQWLTALTAVLTFLAVGVQAIYTRQAVVASYSVRDGAVDQCSRVAVVADDVFDLSDTRFRFRYFSFIQRNRPILAEEFPEQLVNLRFRGFGDPVSGLQDIQEDVLTIALADLRQELVQLRVYAGEDTSKFILKATDAIDIREFLIEFPGVPPIASFKEELESQKMIEHEALSGIRPIQEDISVVIESCEKLARGSSQGFL